MKTRGEEEMLALILGFGEGDDRIRATLMNGSRANPSAAKDIFADYDIANFVTDVAPFRDYDYIGSHFGEALLVQTPEDMAWPPPVGDGRYNYTMQFADGNRIDLSFFHLNTLEDRIEDSLTVVLLDKDGLLPDLFPPSEQSYFITEPTPQLYADCCSEFFFGLGSHIPKTFWRRSLPLLHVYMDVVLRRPLVRMLGWEIGTRGQSAISLGKAGNRLQEHLSAEEWEEFRLTYCDSDFDHIWESLTVFYSMFTRSAKHVAAVRGFRFPDTAGRNAWAFLEHVHQLPRDAESIF